MCESRGVTPSTPSGFEIKKRGKNQRKKGSSLLIYAVWWDSMEIAYIKRLDPFPDPFPLI